MTAPRRDERHAAPDGSVERRLASQRVLARFALRMVIICSVVAMAAMDGASAARVLHQLLILGFYISLFLSIRRRERLNAPVLNGMDEAIWYLTLAVAVGSLLAPAAGPEFG